MLTRSKAKASQADNAIVLVSPSATGKGTHTRWCYPEGYKLPAPALSPPSPKVNYGDGDGYETDSEHSSSDGSFYSFTSSLTSLSSDSSFEHIPPTPTSGSQIPCTPQHQRIITTTPQAPGKLQRSPPAARWVEAPNGGARLVLVPDSFSEDDIRMREAMLEHKLTQIAERELAELLRYRTEPLDLGNGICLDNGGSDSIDGGSFTTSSSSSGLSFIRENTEPIEEYPTRRRDAAFYWSSGPGLAACSSKNLREEDFIRAGTEPVEDYPAPVPTGRLGPHGTELIEDPVQSTMYFATSERWGN